MLVPGGSVNRIGAVHSVSHPDEYCQTSDLLKSRKILQASSITGNHDNNTRGHRSRNKLSNFVLFASIVILVNLFPFQSDVDFIEQRLKEASQVTIMQQQARHVLNSANYIEHVTRCLQFVKLMFTNPVRLGQRTTRFTQAEAKMLGKMAKMWYIKKKIKKFSKKLKKNTIAVPVFTAIPIYEHSYYPQPHVTHLAHSGMHHAAAASSYAPTIAHIASPSIMSPVQSQPMATSASSTNQVATYRAGGSSGHHQAAAYQHPMYAAPAMNPHQIINSYAPSPPLYVDESGGLYGHYGNAYGRYDGGFQLW